MSRYPDPDLYPYLDEWWMGTLWWQIEHRRRGVQYRWRINSVAWKIIMNLRDACGDRYLWRLPMRYHDPVLLFGMPVGLDEESPGAVLDPVRHCEVMPCEICLHENCGWCPDCSPEVPD